MYSIEERARKARNNKRAPGTSGRLHRTNTGDWVWSDDEDENGSAKGTSSDESPEGSLFPGGQSATKAHSGQRSGSFDNQSSPARKNSLDVPTPPQVSDQKR